MLKQSWIGHSNERDVGMDKKSFVTKTGAPAVSHRSNFLRRFMRLRGKSAESAGKRYIAGSILFALLTIGLASAIAVRHPQELLGKGSGISAGTYSDASDTSDGSSFVRLDTSNGDPGCMLKLAKTIDDPYAGISFTPKDSLLGFINLNGFDRLVIDCKVLGTRSLSIDFATFVDGISDRRNSNTARSHEIEIDNQEGRNHIAISIKNATTPAWWYSQNHLTKSQLGPDKLAQTLSLNIGSGSLTKADSPVSISIHSISLQYDNRALILAAIAAMLASLGLLVLAIVRKPELGQPKIRHINLGNRADEELSRLVSWIAEHYDDADATISDAAKASGVSASRVSALIERGFKMSYKQYVTRVRLAEGTRLLRETDRNVTEIAIAVGYQYPTSFNRTFREAYLCSPTEYRRQHISVKKEKIAA